MPDFAQIFTQAAGKHFVALSCVQRVPNGGPAKAHLFSGFVVEIVGEWFYITAGHIIRNLRAALAAGSTFDYWRLADNAAGSHFEFSIPYAFDEGAWVVEEHEHMGYDYAVSLLSPLYRKLLGAGGVRPLAKEAWGHHSHRHDHWAILGVPSESVTYDGDRIIDARLIMSRLHACEAPEGAGLKSQGQFYAKPAKLRGGVFSDADGLSGGPVFSVRKDGNGRWLYHIIGVQSAWYRSGRVLAICPIKNLVLEIERIVSALNRDFPTGTLYIG